MDGRSSNALQRGPFMAWLRGGFPMAPVRHRTWQHAICWHRHGRIREPGIVAGASGCLAVGLLLQKGRLAG